MRDIEWLLRPRLRILSHFNEFGVPGLINQMITKLIKQAYTLYNIIMISQKL